MLREITAAIIDSSNPPVKYAKKVASNTIKRKIISSFPLGEMPDKTFSFIGRGLAVFAS